MNNVSFCYFTVLGLQFQVTLKKDQKVREIN